MCISFLWHGGWKTILSEIEKQQKEFEKKLTEQNSASNPADPYGMPPGMGPGMGPGMAPGMGPGMAPGMGPDAAKPDAPKVERFSLDKEAIKKALRAKYRYDFDGSVNASASGTVDTRSELEIREDIIHELVNSGEIRPESELLQEDQAKCDADYPLYKPGEMVDIAIDLGNTVRRFNGAFKRISPFRIQIGRHMLTLSDLPKAVQARFDEKLNKEMREDYMRRRPITTKYMLDVQTRVADECKKQVEAQMKKNLGRGWVYINDAWKLPEDMLDDVLDFRKRAHKQQFTAPQLNQGWALPGN